MGVAGAACVEQCVGGVDDAKFFGSGHRLLRAKVSFADESGRRHVSVAEG